MPTLFDAELLASVEALVIRTRRVRPGAIHGEHRSSESGAGIEFREHRPYTPGDELGRLDWNVYRRSGKFYSRMADVLRDLPLRIQLDLSASLWHDERVAAAARTAAFALSAVACGHGDQVQVFVCGAASGEPVRVRGQNGLLQLAATLEAAESQPGTDLGACFAAMAPYRARPGLTVVISDFYDAQGLEALRNAMQAGREKLLLLRLFTPEQRSGGEPGEMTLVDCESGAELAVDIDAEALARYRARYQAFESDFDELLMACNAAGLALNAAEPVVPQLEALFPAGSLVL